MKRCKTCNKIYPQEYFFSRNHRWSVVETDTDSSVYTCLTPCLQVFSSVDSFYANLMLNFLHAWSQFSWLLKFVGLLYVVYWNSVSYSFYLIALILWSLLLFIELFVSILYLLVCVLCTLRKWHLLHVFLSWKRDHSFFAFSDVSPIYFSWYCKMFFVCLFSLQMI